MLFRSRLWWRIRAFRLERGEEPAHASRYAALIALGKIDEAHGALRCLWALATGRETLTVEYKDYQRERRAAA